MLQPSGATKCPVIPRPQPTCWKGVTAAAFVVRGVRNLCPGCNDSLHPHEYSVRNDFLSGGASASTSTTAYLQNSNDWATEVRLQ